MQLDSFYVLAQVAAAAELNGTSQTYNLKAERSEIGSDIKLSYPIPRLVEPIVPALPLLVLHFHLPFMERS